MGTSLAEMKVLELEWSAAMPQAKWSDKRERQYQHIKEGAEAGGKPEKVAERRLLRFVRDVRIGECGEHPFEQVGRDRPFLAIERGLGHRVLLLNDVRQHPATDGGERGSHARRRIAVAGKIRRLRGDHRLDRLFGVGGAAQREEAERAVLFDGARLAGRMVRRAQLVQDRERVVVGRGGVQVASRGQVAALLRRGGRRCQQAGDAESTDPDTRRQGLHFFLRSTRRRAGVLSVTNAA